MSNTNLVRASRDGDQFHYLWAARRCLKLLSPDSGLVTVTIEGPSPDEQGSPVEAGEELIDIAEYFGSENITQARLVRYMQLKHSTVRVNDPWTASGLEKTIIGFAKRYVELQKTIARTELASKLEFWFVTNRQISADVAEAVADAANETAARHPGELKKLKRFTGLAGSNLADFCKLLRFEDRQDDYWDQRNILFQDVSGYLPDADVDAPTQLKELVTRRALSEGEKNPAITKIDVLRALKTDERALFPAECRIANVDDAVPRGQEPDLLRRIREANGPVVVHASGGVGKSVFATRIGQGLPPGSVCILYDCFGNGQYRSATGYRHRHKDALVQVANELAAKSLCHLLIPTANADAGAYVRSFVYRLDQAIRLLCLANPDALLCVVVDAADNAQMAAEEIGEARSFVKDLIRASVPDRVRLVFLCRSHRQYYLDPPPDVIALELSPFSRNETQVLLRQNFSDASERDVDEFYRLSSHNPRVQALALSRGLPLQETLRLLGPNPTSVEDAIASLLDDAIAKLKDASGPIERERVEEICAGLAVLRPLVPIAVLSAMSGVEREAIKSFAYDIGRPLLVTGETIQFLDEPAETWFRDKFRPTATGMAAFITSLRPLASQSAYVASALPQLMLEAGQFSELVDLALSSTALPESSPLERRDVELQRLQFALKAGLRTQRYVSAAKLALKAGGETAGDKRQRKLIQENTDLGAEFLGIDLIQEIVSRRTFGSGWVGSHHAYEATLLSGRKELLGDARSRLRMAHEWLQNWSHLTTDERKDKSISDPDIVELTLAHFNIHGPANAANSLRGWTPRDVSFRVGRRITRRLLDHGRFADIDEFSRAAGNNLCLVLAIAVELRKLRKALPSEVTNRALRHLLDERIKLPGRGGWDDTQASLDAITAVLEGALRNGLCSHDQAVALLSRYLPADPPRGLPSRYSNARFPLLRAYCLRAALLRQDVALIDLAHAELKAEIERKNQNSTSQDLQEFQEAIGALLPWHKLWAAVLLDRVKREAIAGEIERTHEASAKAERVHYRDESQTSDEIALLWMDILCLTDTANANALSALNDWKDKLKRPLFTPTLNELCRLCAQRDDTNSAALAYAVESYTLTKDERLSAESKSEGYLEVARAVLTTSKADAKAYFDEAVAVAGKIGDENLVRWDAILDLADRASQLDRPAPAIAYQLSRCAELTYDYVDRDKHFNWEDTVVALCGLCPSSAITILSRWRDRKFGRPGRLLPVILKDLIERNVVDPRDALPLIGFRAEWNYGELLGTVLAKCEKHAEKALMSRVLFRYAQLSDFESSSSLGKIRVVTAAHRVTLDRLEQAIAFSVEQEEARKRKAHRDEIMSGSTEETPARDWNGIFARKDLTTADGIAQAYAAFRRTDTPCDHKEFFAEAMRRVPVGSESGFVEALAATPELGFYSLRDFLGQIPENWKVRPAITHSLANTVKVFCRRYCMAVKKSRYYEMFPFDPVLSQAGLNEAAIADVVLSAIGEAPDLIETGRLFSLVGLIATKLSPDQALEVLTFGLDLFNPVLEDKDGDGPWRTELSPPNDIRESIAGFIWGALAAPAALLRWQGAHAVLEVCCLGRSAVLAHLIKIAATQEGGPFVDARLHFYSFHALQWLLIGLARAALDAPNTIAPHAKQLVDWALNNQPHVVIREFAARCALQLIASGELADADGLSDRLKGANKSTLAVIDSKTYQRNNTRKQATAELSGDDRYYFGIDIGPYWFDPLGRVFALPQNAIEAEALKVIRNDLAFTASGRWDEDQRARRNLYEERHTYHSHGSHPRTDTVHFYHAYHALMIVAGRLLASTPTHRNPEYGEDDKFRDWLLRHDLTRNDGRWLWDRRDPDPFERGEWLSRGKEHPDHRTVTDSDFQEALRSGSELNLKGHWTQADEHREQSTHIYSALVSPDKSEALLRALTTSKDVHHYLIPDADNEMEIDVPGFELKGWVVSYTYGSRLDERDFWAGGVSFPPPRPAPFIIEVMDLTTDADQRFWRDKSQTQVIQTEVWGYYDEGKEHVRSNPNQGSRLKASMPFTTNMLAKLNRELIIEVQIERRRRYQPYERGLVDDDERVSTRAKLYLVNRDGKIRTI